MPSLTATLSNPVRSFSQLTQAEMPIQPVWRSWQTWLLVIAALYFAGAALSSSEEAGEGGVVVETAGIHLAARVLPLISYGIVFILASRSFLKVKRALLDGIPFLVLCLVPFISVLWSQSASQTLKMSIFFALSTVFALWFIGRFSGLQQMQFLMLVGLVAALLSAILCLFVPSVGLSTEKGYAWQGIFYSKNHLGRMMVFLLIAAFHYPWKKLAYKWTYILILAILIVMSRSRTAIGLVPISLAFAISMGLVGKLNKSSRRLVVSFALPIFLVLVTLLAFNLTDIIRALGGDPTLNNRTVIWQILLESGMKRPALGFGYCGFWTGTMGEGFNAMIATVSYMHFYGAYSHSGYIDVFLQLGIAGLCIIAYFIVKGFKDGILCFLNEHRTSYTDWYLSIIVLSTVYNLDEVTFLAPNYLAWMMFIMASVGLRQHLRAVRFKSNQKTQTKRAVPLPLRYA